MSLHSTQKKSYTVCKCMCDKIALNTLFWCTTNISAVMAYLYLVFFLFSLFVCVFETIAIFFARCLPLFKLLVATVITIMPIVIEKLVLCSAWANSEGSMRYEYDPTTTATTNCRATVTTVIRHNESESRKDLRRERQWKVCISFPVFDEMKSELFLVRWRFFRVDLDSGLVCVYLYVSKRVFRAQRYRKTKAVESEHIRTHIFGFRHTVGGHTIRFEWK